jgi:hypothetical protein
MDIFTDILKNDKHFIQALKDFEKMGFIKLTSEGIKILDREGIAKYLNDFGNIPNHCPKELKE